jgi:diguanylate cyclase (GGDEF)-like protein
MTGALPGGPWSVPGMTEQEQSAWLQTRFHERAQQLLSLLKQAIPQARSCVLFLHQPADDRLRLELCIGGPSHDYRDELLIPVGRGAIGWAAKERKPCRYARLDPQRQRPDYYRADAAIRSLLAVPFIAGNRLEGVLCVDSARADALGDREEGLLALTAGCLQAQLEDLRQQRAIAQQNRDFSMLHAASQSLNSGLDLDRRLEAMTEMAQGIVQAETGLLCLVETGERRATIRVVRGGGMDRYVGHQFNLTDGLVSLVVKNRQPILLSQLSDDQPHRFFPLKSKIQMRARSFLGLPLIVQERVIGLLICASDQPSAFTALQQHLLSILCNQAAQAIADAQHHAEIKRQAAIDGLTNMFNHRAFHDRLDYEWKQMQRNGEPLTLMMIDLDHFKRVNDTYGHQTGDRILRQVSALLAKLARDSDTVGRYGGEEFAVLLPGTTAQQASKLAERIRKVVERTRFGPEGVAIQVTLSLGVASAPADAADADHLVSAADKALYWAKEHGRNRIALYAELISAAARVARID